ncbi:Type 1 glutamine amidotransferase-like domain-containing protein [[Clostridium] dakarense]|uniref:Type 1 glutamine amidotransferase-like domain-containing protein n=1 Tax=Faecalimicrobium dakarense TaxID=1301100 RepID=UPI0004AF4079|nr:Type 1 glutamine amidotransferase-like domain-containing protein [[Clostridium] dakarense]
MINILLNQYNFDEKWCFDILNKFINKNHKVLIIPFSFDSFKLKDNYDWQNSYNKIYGKYYNSVISPFFKYGIEEKNINWINYFLTSQEEIINCINDSDILFFTGGLPDKTIDRLSEFNLISCIKNFNGIIMGSSAGAMIQINEYHISPDKDCKDFYYKNGLNMIKDFDIEVHFEETEIQMNSIHKVLAEKKHKIYAMKDEGGIVVNDGEVILMGDVTIFELESK